MVYTGGAFETEVSDFAAVTDRTDHREQLSLGYMGGATYALDPFHYLGDLFFGRRFFHNDHHFWFKPFLFCLRLYFRPASRQRTTLDDTAPGGFSIQRRAKTRITGRTPR